MPDAQPTTINWGEALGDHAAAARGAGLDGCRVKPWLLEGTAAEIARLREVLEYLDRKGGLGLDVHERIRAALSKGRGDGR